MDGYSFTRFDACIDIPNGMLPVTMTPERAIEVVRKAVEAIPGAAWIIVGCSGLVPAYLPWLVLYDQFDACSRFGGAWDALAERSAARCGLRLAG